MPTASAFRPVVHVVILESPDGGSWGVGPSRSAALRRATAAWPRRLGERAQATELSWCHEVQGPHWTLAFNPKGYRFDDENCPCFVEVLEAQEPEFSGTLPAAVEPAPL